MARPHSQSGWFMPKLFFGISLGPGKIKVPRIDAASLKQLLERESVLLFDVKDEDQWLVSREMIRGAKRRDPKRVAEWGKMLASGSEIVLYCSADGEAISARVAEKLLKMGFSHVSVLHGGWLAWKRERFPTSKRTSSGLL
ncbi:MAG: hypothetical protein C0609_06955 [Deltaproteobacteria bacterium]|nr:MAG: hypothetical protein C0609_06955 [Deltaproteobacteria bacterium]